MTVGELRKILETLPDETWVFTRCDGDLGDPSAHLIIDDGEEVLVIS